MCQIKALTCRGCIFVDIDAQSRVGPDTIAGTTSVVSTGIADNVLHQGKVVSMSHWACFSTVLEVLVAYLSTADGDESVSAMVLLDQHEGSED